METLFRNVSCLNFLEISPEPGVGCLETAGSGFSSITYVRGAFGKFVAWHHNSTTRVDKMLSNDTFFNRSYRVQQLLDDLIFVEKGFGVLVQRMIKMSKAVILSKIFVKNEGKLGTLFTILV